jgi:glycosyltransferase involved in cell wall biosynthesis
MTAKRAFTSAKKIIAISCNTKNDLVRLFKINPQKISVIYDGVDERFIPILDRNKIIQGFKKYNLPEKFFLFVSTLEPRKNVVRLLKAYDKLDKLVSFKATKLPHLVLVGQKGWGYREIFETINGARLKNKIVLLDYIKNEDLLVLYNAALAFVFPSLYEGFGLPVLEALACGCPVITSNISSLPEVGNNACLYVNPYQVDEIALAMKRILTDENLRKELQAKGLIQAKKFSWQKTAKETIKVLEI